MSSTSPVKLMTDPNTVTFEAVQPIIVEEKEMRTIRVGYDGELVAALHEYLNSTPSKEGIKYGQWFALPISCDSRIYERILAITPAGQSLEELKATITKLLTV